MEATHDSPHEDAELAALEAQLRRNHNRLARYLRIRAWFGVGLIALGSAFAAMTLVIAGVSVGLWHIDVIDPWTEGFSAVLAPIMPGVTAFICLRAGIAWWRGRHLDSPDPGCLMS